MNQHVRGALMGLAVTVAILLLADLVLRLRISVGMGGDPSSALWGMAFVALIGVVACYGALVGRRDRIVAALPAILLAWPLVSVFWRVVPLPPDWIPLLGGPPARPTAMFVVVGVLAAGALLPRRLG